VLVGDLDDIAATTTDAETWAPPSPDDVIQPRRRRWLVWAVPIAVIALVAGVSALTGKRPAPLIRRDVAVYAGLGAWVDTYDYVPRYAGEKLTITPSSIDALAGRGVRTIYLQAARNDSKTPSGLIEPELLTPLLQRAHANHIAVVGWSTPRFSDVAFDLERLMKIAQFTDKGQRFDGIAVDIEDNETQPIAETRNANLLELSRQLRAAVGPDVALGAIVMPAVQLDIVNPSFWPAFPWLDLRAFYDVWMPMTYWTTRDADTEWRDAARYTNESVTLMRTHLGDPDARVHPIGGIADKTTPDQVVAFLDAIAATGSIGGSLYDAATSGPELWTALAPLPTKVTPLPSTTVAASGSKRTTTPSASTTAVAAAATNASPGTLPATAPGTLPETVPTAPAASDETATTLS